MTVADVGLDSRTAGAQAVYTYRVPEGQTAVPGESRFVSLGPRKAIGFILAVRTIKPDELGFPVNVLKDLGPRINGLEMPEDVLALVHEVAAQTLSPVSVALTLAVPPSVRERLVTIWSLAEGAFDPNLTTAQHEIVRILKEQKEIVDAKSNALPDGPKKSLRALEKKGVVIQSTSLSKQSERHRLTGLYRLTPNQEKVESFLAGQGKKKPAQAITLMRLQGSESASFTVQEIKSLGAVTDQTIKALIQAGLLTSETESGVSQVVQPTPNSDQQKAIDAICKSVANRESKEFLLYGVTGSGKTEVYLRCAAEALKQGRQVLYLVPEIALTAQVIAQLRQRFGNLVAVVHSNMSPSERLDNWLKVKNGECPVVLGPRSALFSPLRNLGLVIVDEEHESSYKQENSPRYQSKRLTTFLGQRFSCPVVYGSATPSIESFYAALSGQLELLKLPSRAASAKLPKVEIVNLAELYKARKASILAPRLDELLREALAKGDQAILFLNRRAYAPFLICRDCGHRFLCRSCAVSLAFHRRDNKLRCHQCGYQEDVPQSCPQCYETRIAPFGTGTEKVEEAVQALFPDYRVARLDRDVARRKGALEEILTAFRSRDIQILVGTQMVAKGLDFPHVTVVGVVAADVSLNVPDFRASERTFQLLSQVAGRAGRGESLGTVVVQTLNPENGAVVAASKHDYESFYFAELEERRMASYPPFVRLVNVLFTGENKEDVAGLSAVAAQRLRLKLTNAEILGPVDCPLERVQNLWRRHVLVKLPTDASVQPLQDALDGLKAPKARIVVDVDPMSLV